MLLLPFWILTLSCSWERFLKIWFAYQTLRFQNNVLCPVDSNRLYVCVHVRTHTCVIYRGNIYFTKEICCWCVNICTYSYKFCYNVDKIFFFLLQWTVWKARLFKSGRNFFFIVQFGKIEFWKLEKKLSLINSLLNYRSWNDQKCYLPNVSHSELTYLDFLILYHQWYLSFYDNKVTVAKIVNITFQWYILCHVFQSLGYTLQIYSMWYWSCKMLEVMIGSVYNLCIYPFWLLFMLFREIHFQR